MKYLSLLLFFLGPLALKAQFTPESEKPLIIIATDGTYSAKDSPVNYSSGAQPTSSVALTDPIRPMGMKESIQAGAFLERPRFGKMGYLLIFSLNDSIGGQQGSLVVNGQELKGVYRLIRPKTSSAEVVPEGMTTYHVTGTIYILGVS